MFLIVKISKKKNLVVVLDFVAVANLKFPIVFEYSTCLTYMQNG